MRTERAPSASGSARERAATAHTPAPDERVAAPSSGTDHARVDLELVFSIANYGVIPAWLLLALAPRWRWTARIVHSALVPALLGTAYGILLFTDPEGSPDASFLTLDGVMAIFTTRQTVIAAWIHYLIFDLFVGAWEVRDAARRGVPHFAVVPCLVLTLLFGPLGLLLYLAIRAAMTRRLSLDESEGAQARS